MIPSPQRFPELPTTIPPNLKFVLSLSPSAMTLGLGNITSLLARLDNPEQAFRTVVVAGTNGKGSVTSMLASILTAEGMRVGRYTSPHVYSVSERICIDGAQVSLDEMEAAASEIAPFHDEIGFSYFEALTAIAFILFARRGVDIAVLETGLGGRFDATNVTEPVATVVTSISVDHRRILGDTAEEILREKLGITRPGVPLLVGAFSDGLRARIDDKARRDNFPVHSLSDLGQLDVVSARLDHTVVDARTPIADYGEITIPFPGQHQRINALLAIGAAERVRGRLTALAQGIRAAYIPGRFEVFEVEGKTIILDVAHNDAALSAAADQLAAISPRSCNALVLGLMKRKELSHAPDKLVQAAARLHLIAPEVSPNQTDTVHLPHSLLANHVIERLTNRPTDVMLWNRRGETDDPWSRLVGALLDPSNPFDVTLVTGSHHVVEQFGRRLFTPGVVA